MHLTHPSRSRSAGWVFVFRHICRMADNLVAGCSSWLVGRAGRTGKRRCGTAFVWSRYCRSLRLCYGFFSCLLVWFLFWTSLAQAAPQLVAEMALGYDDNPQQLIRPEGSTFCFYRLTAEYDRLLADGSAGFYGSAQWQDFWRLDDRHQALLGARLRQPLWSNGAELMLFSELVQQADGLVAEEDYWAGRAGLTLSRVWGLRWYGHLQLGYQERWYRDSSARQHDGHVSGQRELKPEPSGQGDQPVTSRVSRRQDDQWQLTALLEYRFSAFWRQHVQLQLADNASNWRRERYTEWALSYLLHAELGRCQLELWLERAWRDLVKASERQDGLGAELAWPLGRSWDLVVSWRLEQVESPVAEDCYRLRVSQCGLRCFF